MLSEYIRFDFTKLLNKLRLVCIDEVHMLNEPRGSVLEVIVTRMKTLGTSSSIFIQLLVSFFQ